MLVTASFALPAARAPDPDLAASPIPSLLLCTDAEETLTVLPPHADPFAEADEDTGESKQAQNYIHIRIQRTSRLLPRSVICPSHVRLFLSHVPGHPPLTPTSHPTPP